VNASGSKKKHREVAAKGADCGAASTDVSSSRLKRNVARGGQAFRLEQEARAHCGKLAGPALTEKCSAIRSGCPARRAQCYGSKKKRARIAKGRLFGAAWMDSLSAAAAGEQSARVLLCRTVRSTDPRRHFCFGSGGGQPVHPCSTKQSSLCNARALLLRIRNICARLARASASDS